MVLNAHAKRPQLFGHVPTNPAHSEYAKHFPLRVMTEGRRSLATEQAFTEINEGKVEATEGTKSEEDTGVGGGVVHSGGNIGDLDVAGGADRHVDLVVAGAWRQGLVW